MAPIQIYPPPRPILLRRVLTANSHSRSQVGAVGFGRLGGGQSDRSERYRYPRLVLRCLRESSGGFLGCLTFHV